MSVLPMPSLCDEKVIRIVYFLKPGIVVERWKFLHGACVWNKWQMMHRQCWMSSTILELCFVSLSPSALFTQRYTLYALFMANTCAGRNMFTWHLFNQTVSLHQTFPEPRQSSQFTGLNPMAVWPQSAIYDSYVKQRMRYENKSKILRNRCKLKEHNGNKKLQEERKGIRTPKNYYRARCTCRSKITFFFFVNEDVYDVFAEVNRKCNEDLYPATPRCLNAAVYSALMLILQVLIGYTMSFLSFCEITAACIFSWGNLYSPFKAITASSAATMHSGGGGGQKLLASVTF